MTGFGRGEARRDGVTWSVECGSVNRKQLEVVVNLPRDLAELESAVRGVVAAAVSRGRVNVVIRSESAESVGENAVQVDENLAQQYHRSLLTLGQKLGMAHELTLQDITRQPGVLTLKQSQMDATQAWPGVEEALKAALRPFQAMREAEGQHLRQDIDSRLTKIEQLISSIRELAVTVPDHQRKMLRQRLEDAGVPLPLDDERLVKEIALFADRTDISEELNRATSHVKQFRAYLESSEPAGRSLDFLIQEFFREFNTMGSKANHSGIAHQVVTAKTELEKIREQVQNAE